MCLAVPGKIVSIADGEAGTKIGKVDFSGIAKEVSLDFVPDAAIGDYVIVHVGFALSKVDPKEAEQVFEYLRQMGELSELHAPDGSTAPT